MTPTSGLAQTREQFIQGKKPSLVGVAVSAFYLDRDGKSLHMERQSNWHLKHPLSGGVAKPPAVVGPWVVTATPEVILPASTGKVNEPCKAAPRPGGRRAVVASQ